MPWQPRKTRPGHRQTPAPRRPAFELHRAVPGIPIHTIGRSIGLSPPSTESALVENDALPGLVLSRTGALYHNSVAILYSMCELDVKSIGEGREYGSGEERCYAYIALRPSDPIFVRANDHFNCSVKRTAVLVTLAGRCPQKPGVSPSGHSACKKFPAPPMSPRTRASRASEECHPKALYVCCCLTVLIGVTSQKKGSLSY